MKPYIETEVYEKTKRKGALAEEAARVASGMSRTLASAMAQKAPAPSKQGKADAKTKVRNMISQMETVERSLQFLFFLFPVSSNRPFSKMAATDLNELKLN